MHASQGSSAAAAHARYTYTPVFLRRRPPPPLLGFRPAEPVFAAFVTPKPLRATSSRLRASEYARVPAARVVSPPSFFDRKDRLYGVELACSPTGSVEEAVDALRFLSRDEGGADSTLPRPPTTGARSHRKRSRGAGALPSRLCLNFAARPAPRLPIRSPTPSPSLSRTWNTASSKTFSRWCSSAPPTPTTRSGSSSDSGIDSTREEIRGCARRGSRTRACALLPCATSLTSPRRPRRSTGLEEASTSLRCVKSDE